MRNLTIAVSGMNAIDNPGPGVPVVRGLRESSYKDARIVGLCYGALEPGAYMDELVDAAYQMPYPSEGEKILFERLKYINAIENIDVLIPNFDAELSPYISMEKKLQDDLGIRMTLPTKEQFDMRQKQVLSDFGKSAGLTVPHSVACGTMDDFYAHESEFDFPVVVKGRFYEATVVYDSSQLATAFHSLSAQWGLPIIVQQFIRGTELNVVGMGGGDGRLLSYVAMRKMYITEKGKAWAGVSINDETLSDVTRRFARCTNWNGAFELEMIKDEKSVCYLIEVNPRMPAWVYFATAVGQNIPEQTVDLALGKKVFPNGKYDVGKVFIRYSWDMIVDFEKYGLFSVKGERKENKA